MNKNILKFKNPVIMPLVQKLLINFNMLNAGYKTSIINYINSSLITIVYYN